MWVIPQQLRHLVTVASYWGVLRVPPPHNFVAAVRPVFWGCHVTSRGNQGNSRTFVSLGRLGFRSQPSNLFGMKPSATKKLPSSVDKKQRGIGSFFAPKLTNGNHAANVEAPTASRKPEGPDVVPTSVLKEVNRTDKKRDRAVTPHCSSTLLPFVLRNFVCTSPYRHWRPSPIYDLHLRMLMSRMACESSRVSLACCVPLCCTAFCRALVSW
jgi:hypothetical protein